MKTNQRKYEKKAKDIQMPHQSTTSYKGLNYLCFLYNRAIKFRRETIIILFNCRKKCTLVHKQAKVTCNFLFVRVYNYPAREMKSVSVTEL